MSEWIPPDIRPRTEPERRAPSADEMESACQALLQRYEAAPQGTRESHIVAGALAAALWTLGRSSETPMTGKVHPFDDSPGTYMDELALAGLAGFGKRPEYSPDYGRGVERWLYWSRGVGSKPGWFNPQPLSG